MIFFGLLPIVLVTWVISILLKLMPFSSYAKNISWWILLVPIWVPMIISILYVLGLSSVLALLYLAMSVW